MERKHKESKVQRKNRKMNGELQNQTLDVYIGVFTWTSAIFIILLQIFYEMDMVAVIGRLVRSIPPLVPIADFVSSRVSGSLISLLLSILMGSFAYTILFHLVLAIEKRRWIRKYNECFVNGTWYHMHLKEKDDQYLRVGRVTIRQHFFDLDVEAMNYNLDPLTKEERELPVQQRPVRFGSQKKVTRWSYILSSIDEKGGILACYQAIKKLSNNRFNRGLHELRVVERDEHGYPIVLQGDFGDITPSESEGYLEFYRATNVKRSGSFDTSDAPQSWLDAVNHARSEVEKAAAKARRKKEGTMKYQEVIDLVHSMKAIATDKIARNEIAKKGDADYVTQVDMQISSRIREGLATLYPTYGFFSEEEKGALSDPCWILDPIDGTTNLIFDYQMSSVSLGLYENGEIVFGIVYNPYTEETFLAVKGEGATLNGQPIHVSSHEPKDSLVEFGAGSTRKAQADESFALALSVFKDVLDIRRICSSALDLCYIACGRIDGYFERVLKPWDVAAGSLILTEAGGKISDYEGEPLQFATPTSVVASNGRIQSFLLRKIAENTGK
ncbi:MAG: inositol monophosphatase [Lachnospiraceae bacterium]|nr:inositol monophosphatase [Lachnospiraceae bacterium]